MPKDLNTFSEDWFLKRGYRKNVNGGFDPPPFKNPLYEKNDNPVPAIRPVKADIKIPTEWFITYSVPSKKNSRQNFVRNGKQISIPSKSHSEYVKVTALQYKVFGIEFRDAVEFYNVSYPLYVEFKFVRSTRHRWDMCNACQTCEDPMVSNNWIKDDSADYLIPVFVPYEYDKNNPGVRIRLLIDK